MPRIVQYNAPAATISESVRGSAAFEQSGRRLGPLYNEAARYQKAQGAIAAQEYKALTWPFDIAKLNEGASSGGGFHVTNPRAGNGITAPEKMPDYGATDQISRGAAALGNALRDGGHALASPTKAAPIQRLAGGNLVTQAQDDKLTALYNKGIDDDVSQTTKDAVNLRDYWTKYNGGDPKFTDQSGFSSQPSDYSMYGPNTTNYMDKSSTVNLGTAGPDVVIGGDTNSTGFFSGLSYSNSVSTDSTGGL